MSAKDFKDQATRLAKHLHAVHGLTIKRTAALAAVAASHGVKNWNTLLAGGAAVSPPTALPARDRPPFHAQRADYPVALTGAGPAVLTAQLALASRALRESRTTIFVNSYGGLTESVLRDLAKTAERDNPSLGPVPVYVFRIAQPGLSTLDYQPFGLTPSLPELKAVDVLVSKALDTLPPAPKNSPGADYFRQQANYALTVLIRACSTAGWPISLELLAALVNSEAMLERLLSAVSTEPVRQELADFLNQFRQVERPTSDSGPVSPIAAINPAKLKTVLGGLAGRLALVAQSLKEPPLVEKQRSFYDVLGRRALIIVDPSQAIDVTAGYFVRSMLYDAHREAGDSRIKLPVTMLTQNTRLPMHLGLLHKEFGPEIELCNAFTPAADPALLEDWRKPWILRYALDGADPETTELLLSDIL